MARNKYFGVVEGFYRRPYTHDQRCDLIKFLVNNGLNTYVYAPKSDIYHRKAYSRFYPGKKIKEFKALNQLAKNRGVLFNYALAPGTKPDSRMILQKIKQVIDAGIVHYSLLYDDIKVPMTSETAEIQSDTANQLFDLLRVNNPDSVLFFCPTQYCGFEQNDYISTIGQQLDRQILIFWTGNKVVSRRITLKQTIRITRLLGRPPLIWDNLFANDYIPGTIFRTPYHGREPGIVNETSGILINPMNEYRWSKPLIYTAALFFKNPHKDNGHKAWQEAEMRGYKDAEKQG